MSIAAVIFDLDGTVVADEDEYGAAFAKVLRSLGAKVTSSYPHVGGIGVKENWPVLLKKYKIKTSKSIEQLTKETQDAYFAQIDQVTLKSGLREFIGQLRERGVKTALATSNASWIVEALVEKLGLQKYFDAITTGEEVRYKKPDPDTFLVTAGKLGVEQENCLVFEDSAAGIIAAQAAGMKVVGIFRNKKHAEELKEADMLVKNFRGLPLAKISNL